MEIVKRFFFVCVSNQAENDFIFRYRHYKFCMNFILFIRNEFRRRIYTFFFSLKRHINMAKEKRRHFFPFTTTQFVKKCWYYKRRTARVRLQEVTQKAVEN